MPNCSFLLSDYFPLGTFLVLNFILLVVAGVFLFSIAKDKVDFILVGILIGGGLLNFLQRLFSSTNCVLDPWNFFGLFHFNFPDVLVTAGALTLFVRYIIRD